MSRRCISPIRRDVRSSQTSARKAHSSPPGNLAPSQAGNRSAPWITAHGNLKYPIASPAHTKAATTPRVPHPDRLPPAPRLTAKLPVRQNRQPARGDQHPALLRWRRNRLEEIPHVQYRESPESARVPGRPPASSADSLLRSDRKSRPVGTSSPSHRVPNAALPPLTSSR